MGKACVLASTIDLPREEWLELRRQGIGSSDAAAVVGLSPWHSALEVWLDKIGQAEEKGFDRRRQKKIRAGLAMEPIILALLNQETGLKPRRYNAILQHPEHPFMLANLDYRLPGNAPVEVKNTEDRRGEWNVPGTAPEYYLIQVHHQIAVTGAEYGLLVALVNGWDLRIIYVERDEEICRLLVEREAAFWECVKNLTPPCLDGSSMVLRGMYKVIPGLAINLAESYYALAEQYIQARDREKAAETAKDELGNRIKYAIGGATMAIIPNPAGGPGVRCTWPEIQPKDRFDTARFQSENSDLYNQYLSPTQPYRRFTVSPIKIKEKEM